MELVREATERVSALEKFPLEDGQPNVEGPSLAIAYDSFIDYNFADRNAFDTRWTDETHHIAQLRDIIRQGDLYVNMLYTYRSCSKALPQVKSSEQANRNEIYEGMYEVLEPEINKLKKFMLFQGNTIKTFCEHIRRLTAIIAAKDDKKKEETGPSDTYIWYLIQLLDRFALLDALKNMKACLNNDFAFYKRAFGFLRKNMNTNDDQTQENHTLYLFLAHQNSLTSNLKTELQQIAGFDDVINAIVNFAADSFEAERYMTPSEKHCLLRVMPYGLFLMDGEAPNSPYNIFKNKKIKIGRFSIIFKKYPIVPLYGDMQISLEANIRRSIHFDERSWGGSESKLSIEYEIINFLDATRNQYNEYLCKFQNMINEIPFWKREHSGTVPPNICKEITSTVIQGFQLLSDWSSKVLLQSAWKYSKPNNDPTLENLVEYERVVRHNYKPEEKVALVEFIAIIKGLASIMLKQDGVLSPIISSAIHDEVQEFVQIGMRDVISLIMKKKKKDTAKNELLQLRFISADWITGREPLDFSEDKKKGKGKEQEKIQIPTRPVGPSLTQLVLIRSTVCGLLQGKKKDYTSQHIKIMEDFYARSFFFEYLLNYANTITSITDLGDLWYREFYLELTKRLQFPIDMSLPWILTDHLLESKDASLMEYLFYPLDLYNDSARRALNSLNQQFLYDEIEAEVNLCFDQLVYKLSEQIYVQFKSQASSILLDKPYRSQLELLAPSVKLHVSKSRYDVILRQRHIKLLGRSIDLNNLIAQRMNTYLRQNIEFAISRFEASDLACIVELEMLIFNVHLTHHLLSEYLELDPWYHIYQEVDESTSLISFHGRIVLHVIFEIIYDFASNFNFNGITNRFIRTPLPYADVVPRDAPPKTNPNFLFGSKSLNTAYSYSSELSKGFIGSPHINAIVNLVGHSNLPLIVSECIQNMDLKLRSVLAPYVRELFGGMPQSSKLPIHDYGTEGGYGYFQLKLKDIINYPDLQSAVLQNFREVGNITIFLNMLDSAISQFGMRSFLVAAPFLGITPQTLSKADPSSSDPFYSSPLYSATESLTKAFQNKPELAKAPSELKNLIANAWKADKFYRPPKEHFSIFKSVLERINLMLNAVRTEWCGGAPDNGVLGVDSTTEFYRLWSGLQFVCCLPAGENTFSNHELFGDGLFWAGSMFIFFLGQQKRFETFDFSYHILNVEESASVPCTNESIKQFFKKVSIVRDLNQTVFNLLSAYVVPRTPEISIFHPPENDNDSLLGTGDGTNTLTRVSMKSLVRPQQSNTFSTTATATSASATTVAMSLSSSSLPTTMATLDAESPPPPPPMDDPVS